uniref:Uncharacterized protein n=1 Tax=Oncorhynchus mykiss TaxID=8022 RepID=A0A8C7VDM6_ONCMY
MSEEVICISNRLSHLSRLDGCKLTYKSCETLTSALQTPNSPLRELDLSYNDLGDRGVELLCVGLTSPLCNIQTLVLGQCGLTEGCCSDLASVLSSPNSQLKQLQLRDNDLQNSGVTLLSAELEDPDCKLDTLGLSGCLVTEEGCAALSSALRSNLSHLKELDLSYNHPGVSAGGLLSPLSRLDRCKLTYKSCETLTSALQTPNSPLRELDLSYNDLGDRGVELLCVGLTSPLCNIQTLVCVSCRFTPPCQFNNCVDIHRTRLVDCKITHESCETLTSALQTPNSPLRELNLSNNDLGDRGVELLCVGLTSPLCNIQTLV